MQGHLVTVVIPVYNVEKYLDRCISSIVNQTYTALEILLIDDGSMDNCPRMCDEWALRDDRIKVIHKKNAGLGMARNTGIENASGKYICFFDSDDYISEDLIEKAYIRIEQEQADIALYGYIFTCPEKGRYVKLTPQPSKEVYQGEEVCAVFLPEYLGDDPETGKAPFIPSGACGAMYAMDLISRTNWRFVSERDIISEDIYSHLILYKHVRKVVILKEALYYYCENNASLTHAYRPDRLEKIKHLYECCVSVCRENGYPKQVERRCMEPFMAATMAILKQEIGIAENGREAANRVRKIVDDETLQRILKAKEKDKTNPKRRLLLWAMRHKCCYLCCLLITAQRVFRRS